MKAGFAQREPAADRAAILRRMKRTPSTVAKRAANRPSATVIGSGTASIWKPQLLTVLGAVPPPDSSAMKSVQSPLGSKPSKEDKVAARGALSKASAMTADRSYGHLAPRCPNSRPAPSKDGGGLALR